MRRKNRGDTSEARDFDIFETENPVAEGADSDGEEV